MSNSAVKIRLAQLAEQLDELASEEWAADWLARKKTVMKQFNVIRSLAKKVLGLSAGGEFWDETNPFMPTGSSRLEDKKALESAIRKAAEILRVRAA